MCISAEETCVQRLFTSLKTWVLKLANFIFSNLENQRWLWETDNHNFIQFISNLLSKSEYV